MDYEKQITWGSVRNKNLKSLLICEYVLEIQRDLGLSTQEAKELKDFINEGILLKYINSKDIVLNEDGTKIDDIEGINIGEKLYENRCNDNLRTIDVVNTSTYQYFYNYWHQFLSNWNKLNKIVT